MKIKNHYKLIIQILFFISIFNTLYSKNFDKSYDEDSVSNYFSGILALNNNDYKTSYKYLKQLEGLEDNHYNFSSYYEYSLVNEKRFKEAFLYSKKIEKKNIGNFESNIIIGTYYLKNKKYNQSRKYFAKAESNFELNSLQKLTSGIPNNWLSLINLNEKDGIILINKIPDRFKNIKRIQNALAHCFYNSKKTNLVFKKLTSGDDIDFSRYNFFHANYLYKIKEEEKAFKVIDDSLEFSPRNLILNQFKQDMFSKNGEKSANQFDCRNSSDLIAEIFYIAANALSSQEKYIESNFYINLAKYLNPNFTSYEILYAENLFALKEYKKAKKILSTIKNKGKFYNWFAVKQIVSILNQEQKKDELLILLNRSYKELNEPTIYETYDYANALRSHKKFRESVNFYTKVYNVIDKNHHLYPNVTEGRGIAYEQLQDWTKAEKDLVSSIDALPDQAYVLNYLAYSWIEQGVKINKSLEMLKKANELKKNDGYIIDSLGWALFKLKKYKEAKEYLQLAVRIMPSDPIVNDHFADSLWMNNKPVQARYFWNYALSLEKTDEKLKKIINQKLFEGLKKKS